LRRSVRSRPPEIFSFAKSPKSSGKSDSNSWNTAVRNSQCDQNTSLSKIIHIFYKFKTVLEISCWENKKYYKLCTFFLVKQICP
jgi:hypothetical protein